VTTYDTEEDIRRALLAGAKGYLLKGALSEQILETVRNVAQGEALVPPRIASMLTESLSHPELSNREFQVLPSVSSGQEQQGNRNRAGYH
jgi:DNA-binding NarL/FixJ family response regulator